MSWITDLRNRVGNAIRVRESVGLTVDPDEHMFRPILETPDPDDPLSDVRRDRTRKIARVQYFRNPIGAALIETHVSRVVGAGVQWKAKDERAQETVDRFVNDPDNNLGEIWDLFVAEFLAYGELFCPIYLTKENADVRLGSLLPDEVEAVLWKRGDRKRPLAYVQRRLRMDDRKRLWIIPHPEAKYDNRFPPHPELTEEDEPNTVRGEDGLRVALPTGPDGNVLPEVQELLDQGDILVAGYGFYARNGSLVSGRGRSIYERVADYIKAVDDWWFNTLRHAILQGAFIWQVILENATPEEVKKRRDEIVKSGPPKPGSVLVTNEKEKWEAKTPSLPAASALREIFTGALKLIGLGVGIPGHELGAEDDTNRATAGESRCVSINRAKRLQRKLASIGTGWITYQLDQKVYRGQLPEGIDRTVECVMPELDAKDEGEVSTSVKARVEAMLPALDRGLVLEADARRFVYEAMGQEMPDETAFKTAADLERQNRDEGWVGDGSRLKAIADQIRQMDPETVPSGREE